MLDIDRFDLFDPAKARDLGVDGLEIAGSRELGEPGLFIFRIRHIVVGVIAGNDHKGTKDDFAVAAVREQLHAALDGIPTGDLVQYAGFAALK